MGQFPSKLLHIINILHYRYTINGEDKRISTLALFKKGIVPKFEDPANKKGGEFRVTFEGVEDMNKMNQMWENLILLIISAEIPQIG
jgi:hypothetical protein